MFERYRFLSCWSKIIWITETNIPDRSLSLTNKRVTCIPNSVLNLFARFWCEVVQSRICIKIIHNCKVQPFVLMNVHCIIVCLHTSISTVNKYHLLTSISTSTKTTYIRVYQLSTKTTYIRVYQLPHYLSYYVICCAASVFGSRTEINIFY